MFMLMFLFRIKRHSHHELRSAPTDEAFANLFDDFPGLEDYLGDNIDVLQDILKLHVSPANADSVILKESAEPFGGTIKIPSLTEEFVKITVSDDGIMINDSNVVLANIIANNGKICSM